MFGDTTETMVYRPTPATPPDFVPATLSEAATHLRLRRGERLFDIGQPVRSIYFVRSGELKAVRYLPDGRESVMLRATADEFFGESALLVEHYVCTAYCVRDAQIVCLPAALFRDCLRGATAFAYAFSLRMAAAARYQCSRYERLRLGKASERLLHLLNCETGADGVYVLKAPLVELANELALEPETLYRVLRELERDGLIARDRRSLVLLRGDSAPGISSDPNDPP